MFNQSNTSKTTFLQELWLQADPDLHEQDDQHLLPDHRDHQDLLHLPQGARGPRGRDHQRVLAASGAGHQRISKWKVGKFRSFAPRGSNSYR